MDALVGLRLAGQDAVSQCLRKQGYVIAPGWFCHILKHMTCGVFGPGLVGSYLGAAAGSTVIKPGPQGRPRAKRIRLAHGEITWQPTVVEVIPIELPTLVACRVHQTPWEIIPKDALAAQNGMGQPRSVAVCFFAVDVDNDVLHVTGPAPRLVVGKITQQWQPVLQAWRQAGIQVDEVEDVRPAQWEKVILNATVGPLCLSTGLTMAGVWSDPELRQLTIDATEEGVRIASINGIHCDQQLIDRAISFFSQVGDHHPSVVEDAGELPWVLNPLLESARKKSLQAPALQHIATLVSSSERAYAANL